MLIRSPKIVVLLIAAFAAGLAAKNLKMSACFDLGPATDSSCLSVTANDIYTPANGYGLEAHGYKTFSRPQFKILGTVARDGLTADSIGFIVNLTPGDYWAELLFGGGTLNEWRGRIRFNDSMIEDTLKTYYVSQEGDEPPRVWRALYPARISASPLRIVVQTIGQPTEVAGIRLFKQEVGPIVLQDGELAAQGLSSPNVDLILKLLNAGQPQEASRLIDAIPDSSFGFEKALLLLAQAGRLEIDEPRPLIEWAVRLLERESKSERRNEAVALNLHLARLYLQADDYYKMAGWDWAKESSGEGIFMRLELAARALEEMAQVKNHPLYHRAVWYLGKMAFWDWVEEHGSWQKHKADQCFQILKPFYPEHRLLRMYLGEQVRSPEIAAPKDGDGPAWAVAENRALKGILSVIHYWVENRQAENGEMGGKYDDDVEMLRWWPVARLAADDSLALVGLTRIVNGIWNSAWIRGGFSAKVRDVEHSSEPVADTQPMMIGLDYGNPIYVERCMASARLMRDLWTGVNKKGHRHFKSSWYSSSELDTRPPRDCDVPMNARTVKAVRWLAWYNHHPEAIRLIREWSDAWLKDCLRTDRGKPYGVVPSAIRYDDDAIGGYGPNWYDSDMFWSYYNFRGGTRMMQQFLATYALTGDEKYLQPIDIAIQIVQKYSPEEIKAAAKGSEAWVAGILQNSKGFARVLEQWRLLTGDSRYDAVVKKYGSDYMKFLLTGEKNWLIQGSDHIIKSTFFNRELITTEAYFTDRVDIGDVHLGQDWAGSHLESMYTGNSLMQGFFPFYRVTWGGLGEDFSAVVLGANHQSLRVVVYNFADHPVCGRLSFWQLSPGVYEYLQGPDLNDDALPDQETTKDEFEVVGRSASHAVTLPSRQVQVIHVRHLHDGISRAPVALPDLALAASELKIDDAPDQDFLTVAIPVHNIGVKDAENIRVILQVGRGDQARTVAATTIRRLSAPLDLQPRMAKVEFKIASNAIANGQAQIVIDPKNRIHEITETNNSVVLPR